MIDNHPIADHRWIDPTRLPGAIARGHASLYRDKVRAQVVMDAAGDYTNAAIARRQRVSVDMVRKWRGRFAAGAGTAWATGNARAVHPRFTPVQLAQVKALACELPATSGVPLSRSARSWPTRPSPPVWVHRPRSTPPGRRRGPPPPWVDTISASTVRRWLRRDALKPWQYRSWIAPRAYRVWVPTAICRSRRW
jgi:transposase